MNMKTKEITRMALLTAIALTIFMVEAQLPGLVAYLPVMILIGIFTGAFTGMCAQLLTERLKF